LSIKAAKVTLLLREPHLRLTTNMVALIQHFSSGQTSVLLGIEAAPSRGITMIGNRRSRNHGHTITDDTRAMRT